MNAPDKSHRPLDKTPANQSNWYAKLHPIGTAQQTRSPKRLLNLSIFFRIWLAVALVLSICGVVAFTQLFGYVKPTAQQVIEDTLLDTSKLLAATLQLPLASGQLYDDTYQATLDATLKHTSAASSTLELTQAHSNNSNSRVYVTDANGVVIYDSLPAPLNAEGQDYSRWNDVYLTLQGRYGARSTADIDSTRGSSIMYVAQPIIDSRGAVIGVVSVGKPVDSVLPYLDNTRNRMLITALLMSIAALILAGLVAWWLKQSITLVTHYTNALAEDTKKPYFYFGHELNSLTDTIESMKHRLENRAYVTDYVHTLTHELKSPLTAIRASSELLEDEQLDAEDRQMLNHSVAEQSIKMQQLIDRLLLLAKVEQPTFKLNRQLTALLPVLQTLTKNNSAKLQQQNLPPIKIYSEDKCVTDLVITEAPLQADSLTNPHVFADPFWLVQALQNVLDNAIYFANTEVILAVYSHAHDSSDKTVTIDIFNDGKPLPEYALSKAFDRYFSLSHQSSQTAPDQANTALKKGTGLGLTLVKQVIEHHGGHVNISNVGTEQAFIRHDKSPKAGVSVRITLPLA
ncbi:two-component system sensor histidine kinase CreC [Psychrobacter sp. KFRI-CH2-11]|uniref:two-component system sensor histidine kinase CreC n=1 Tax=Psychrobacter sp. KFRI-CH2-11 TaxID=3156079 RepID=UPI00324DBF67